MLPQHQNLTPDRALAELRSRASKPGSSFEVISEFTSTIDMQEFAQRSLEAASSQHVSLYGESILLDVLETGGYLILETDSTTGDAISINLVSSGTDGHVIIESHKIEGNFNAVLAKELIKKSSDFVDVLLGTPLSGVNGLESRFYESRFPQYDSSGEPSLFAIPRAIREIKDDQSEKSQLAALFGVYSLWPVRYALLMPVYSASPYGAFRLALEKQQALVNDFMQKNNKRSDFIDELEDLESVRTPKQLRERAFWFRRLDNFLEEAFEKDNVSSTFAINKRLSTIVLFLGSTRTGTEDLFSVMTCSGPGLIVNWKQLTNGSFAITQVSLGGD